MKAFITLLFIIATINSQRLLQSPTSECVHNIITDLSTLANDIERLDQASMLVSAKKLYNDFKTCISPSFSSTLLRAFVPLKMSDECEQIMKDMKALSDDSFDNFSILSPGKSEDDIVKLLGKGQELLKCIPTTTDACANDKKTISDTLNKMSGEVSVLKGWTLYNDVVSLGPVAQHFMANCASQTDDCKTKYNSMLAKMSDLVAKLKGFDMKGAKVVVDDIIDMGHGLADGCVAN